MPAPTEWNDRHFNAMLRIEMLLKGKRRREALGNFGWQRHRGHETEHRVVARRDRLDVPTLAPEIVGPTSELPIVGSYLFPTKGLEKRDGLPTDRPGSEITGALPVELLREALV